MRERCAIAISLLQCFDDTPRTTTIISHPRGDLYRLVLLAASRIGRRKRGSLMIAGDRPEYSHDLGVGAGASLDTCCRGGWVEGRLGRTDSHGRRSTCHRESAVLNDDDTNADELTTSVPWKWTKLLSWT